MPTLQEQIDATKAQIDELNLLIREGVRQVTLRGQTTTYNTTDSLVKARDDAERKLLQLQAQVEDAAPRGGRVQYLYHAGRGY